MDTIGKINKRTAEMSPRLKARLAGIFQLLEAITATSGQVIILGRLVVAGNASATAANILGHQGLLWLGFASCIIGVICHIIWALLLYDLFKPVNRGLSSFAAFVIMVGCAIQAVAILLYISPLLILTGGSPAAAFTTGQLQQLSLLFISLNTYAFNIYLVFFGLWCILIGRLIFRSVFLPRILGVLLTISGLGWMMFLYPPFAVSAFPFIAAASAIGEVPLEFWLIIKSVNSERWNEQAGVKSI